MLTPQETEEIFEVLRRLAAEGHSIVFISHKLYEVLEIADRITVIRRGKVVGERIPSETNEEDLAELMVGREVSLIVDRGELAPGAARPSRSRAWSSSDDRGQEVVHGIDLDVAAGEILGIAGVAGNGQDELVEAIVGLRKPAGGRVILDGKDITGRKSARRLRGRRRLRPGRPPSLRAGPVVQHRRQPRPDQLPPAAVRPRHPAQRRRDLEDGRGADQGLRRPDAVRRRQGRRRCPAATSRRSSSPASSRATCRLLVLDQPTRGLDVGSIEFIHRQVDRQARRRDGDPAGLRRARRGPRAVRPDRRHLSRQARRHPRRADGRQERDRAADGDRRSRGGDDGDRRAAAGGDRDAGPPRDALRRAWRHPRPAAHLDRPVGPGRLAGHHLLRMAGHRRAPAGPGDRRLRRADRGLGRVRARDRQHARRRRRRSCSAACRSGWRSRPGCSTSARRASS